MPDSAEPTFRGFYIWKGLGVLWYGRKRNTSPPVVIRATSKTELHDLIDGWWTEQAASNPLFRGRLHP